MTRQAHMPTRRDEAWRYSDLKALAAAYALPAANDCTTLETIQLTQEQERRTVRGMGKASHTEQRIDLASGQSTTLVEAFEGNGWINHIARIFIGNGASLTHIILQQGIADAVTTLDYQIALEPGATYRAILINLGSHFGRIGLQAAVGQGAHAEVSGIQLGQSAQTLEIISQINHNAPAAVSRQMMRTILTEKAIGTYLGKIRVTQGAQKTDAEQSSRSLLLTRTATANTKPELEIYTDDVKCAHGATVGELDKQALFYMATRGIDPAEARALLTEAFVADVIASIADLQLQAEITDLVTTKLRLMVRGEA